MNFLNEILKKLKDLFNIIAVISFILAIVSLFDTGVWQKVVLTLLIFVTVLLLLTLITRVGSNIYRKAKFYRSWYEAPQNFGIVQTLKYLSDKTAELEIIGRTCFQWLCGDENKFYNSENAKEKQNELQRSIKEAIQKGSTIHFILQKPNIQIPRFDKIQNEKLSQHLKDSISSFEKIKSELSEYDNERFTLSFSNEIIENSMVQLIENNITIRFIFDLGIRFKTGNNLDEITKPFLLVPRSSPAFPEFKQEFDHILTSATRKEEYDKKKEEGINSINSLIKEYPYYSSLRGDKSSLLAVCAARYFLSEKESFIKESPPISVQLLITNRCTTSCKMCDHYKLDNHHDLTKDEIFCTLECIKDLGSNSIIISGGEPLAREDIFEILNKCKDLKLKIGLLTNGIKSGGFALNSNEAEIIANTCSWVQISIDAFENKTYELIRGKNYLGVVLESLKELSNSKLQKIEACFTIQKDNIIEVPDIAENSKNLIPRNIPIRLKFAHGKISGKNFYCNVEQLKELLKKIPRSSEGINFEYLISMFQEDNYNIEELSQGYPLKSKMHLFRTLGYTCHALKLACKIDSKGDVYPCCFLFDDNNANSKFRDGFKIGSLRKNYLNRVMSPSEQGNPLKRIWYESEILNGLRYSLLPIDIRACNCCTRHFYQNEFLNNISMKYKEFQQYGLAEEFYNSKNKDSVNSLWI